MDVQIWVGVPASIPCGMYLEVDYHRIYFALNKIFDYLFFKILFKF